MIWWTQHCITINIVEGGEPLKAAISDCILDEQEKLYLRGETLNPLSRNIIKFAGFAIALAAKDFKNCCCFHFDWQQCSVLYFDSSLQQPSLSSYELAVAEL